MDRYCQCRRPVSNQSVNGYGGGGGNENRKYCF